MAPPDAICYALRKHIHPTGVAMKYRKSEAKEYAGFADYSGHHRDIIERFGRFPHRNKVLGRASTPEETEFLKQPGSSF